MQLAIICMQTRNRSIKSGGELRGVPSRVNNEKAPIGELISVSLYRGNAGSSKVGSALLCLLLVLCTLCFAGARCLPDVDSRWPGRNQASNACVDNLTTRVHVIVVIRVVGREVWSGMQGTIELSEEGREKYFPSSENLVPYAQLPR